MKIKDIRALEILDSRGNPTIYAEVLLENGITSSAMVPSGASTGEREALELRDGDSRYTGKGVQKAVNNIENIIKPALIGMSVLNQHEIDAKMISLDNTDSKSSLGANAILGVSLAVCRASAKSQNLELFQYINKLFQEKVGSPVNCALPVPMMNIINGGCHADNSLDIQEFMIQPRGFQNFNDAIRAGAEVFHALKTILHKKGLATSVGDEGGFAPNLKTSAEAIEVILEAITKAGYNDQVIKLCLDVAGSELNNNGIYSIDGKNMDNLELVNYFDDLVNRYPIVSIEDAFAENDNVGWKNFTDKLTSNIQIVGDDLFTTNPKILKSGIENGLANSILIKINQIGTVSETLECMAMAKKAGYSSVSSHRSGETEDTFIADLAVGTGCGQIKTGSLSRTDRTAKYNRLLWIEKFGGINNYYKFN